MKDTEYADKQKALFDENKIPEELRGPLSHLAWEQGHSAGYNEVYIDLQDLVFELATPLKAFAKRVAATGIAVAMATH